MAGNLANPKTATINISITPSPLPPGQSVSVSIVKSSGAGSASVTPSTLTQSGSVTLSGVANSDSKNNLTIQVTYGDKVLAISSPFTVSTWPDGAVISTGTAGLRFGCYAGILWLSESGNINDLGNCQTYEIVVDTPNSPPFYAPSGTLNASNNPITMAGFESDKHWYPEVDVDCSTGASGTHTLNQTWPFYDTVMQESPGSMTDTISYSCEPLTGNSSTVAGYQFTTSVAPTTNGASGSASCTETGP